MQIVFATYRHGFNFSFDGKPETQQERELLAAALQLANNVVVAMVDEATPKIPPNAVRITHCGEKAIQVVKVIRQYTSLGLAEAKAITDLVAHAGKAYVSTTEGLVDVPNCYAALVTAGATVEMVSV